jgi:hypothetical protein
MGLVPGIDVVKRHFNIRISMHLSAAAGATSLNLVGRPGVDGRDKPGHDAESVVQFTIFAGMKSCGPGGSPIVSGFENV